MSEIDISELQKIITGRVEPHIYSFATNTLPNYLKVGDTYRPVEARLDEWRKYYKDLEEVSRHKATINDKVFFRDYAVHKYLTQIGIKQVPWDASKNVYSKEFFEGAQKSDVAKAVIDIILQYKKSDTYDYYNDLKEIIEYHYQRTQTFSPRTNQQVVIDAFNSAVKNGRTNLLMFAVMRFGKSITSMWSAKNIDSKLTVIVSAKADVRSEWKQTVESHKDFIGFRFIDKDDLKKGMKLSDLYGKKFQIGGGHEEVCTNIVIFLTLQDLAGSADILKRHHEILQTAQVDLLIIDETHFGARAQVLGKILAGVEVNDGEKELLKNDKEDPIQLGSLNKLKAINAKIKLHLSGTPYRILMGSEFEPEDIIAFVQFGDIYEAKLQWNAEHLDDNEWNNPYYGFPQMVRFAFNPNESSRKKLSKIPGSNPAELFTPLNINKSDGYEKFVHEQEVIELLQVLDGSKNDMNMLGLLDNETVKAGKLARHIVMVLPYRASCDALEQLIAEHNTIFKNIAEYEIFNISGYNQKLHTPEEIKLAIAKAESAGKKTITLTVNKMLTGTTVRQWDTMIYLKATSSPQEYDQAIFRLQSPWVEKYQDEHGDSINYDMKPQTLLVDLDPTRIFSLQEMKAFTYGLYTQQAGSENIEEIIKRELKISPILTLNADRKKLVEVTATNIIDQVRKYSSERNIVDDVKEVGVDLSLQDIPEIFAAISSLPELGSKNGMFVKPNQEDGEELDGEIMPAESEELDEKTSSKKIADEDKAEDASSFEKRLRTFYLKILLFAFLSSTEEKSLTDVINNLDINDDNKRIARNLDLHKNILVHFRENINPSILRNLDYKIYNSDFRFNDDSVSPIEHINNSIHKFGRMSESEIFTPPAIVDKMYEAFDETFWSNVKDAKVLDIASKSGSFANGFIRKALQNGVSLEEIKNNFYSVPTSPAAYEFTRKMYEVLGLNIENIVSNFTSYDLIKLSDDQIKHLLSQDKKFCDISVDDLGNYDKMSNKKSEGNMKFTAVVGNPPYDIRTNTNFAKSIYHEFFDAAITLNPDFVTMIHPAKFLFNSGATPKSWNHKMLTDPHLSIKLYEPDIRKIFPQVGAKGGVCITFWNKSQKDGGLNGIFIAFQELQTILTKAKSEGMNKIISAAGGSRTKMYIDKYGRKRSYFRTSAFFDLKDVFTDKYDKEHTIKIVGLEKGNKRSVRYISENMLNDINLKKWKVFLPKSNGSGIFGEILSTPFIGEPHVGSTESFIQIGSFDSRFEAQNCMKYIKTSFCRALLGSLKITQDNPRSVWKNVPFQDFTQNSDIDWGQSVADIDKQLYKKYGLDEKEINFIETHVKAME